MDEPRAVSTLSAIFNGSESRKIPYITGVCAKNSRLPNVKRSASPCLRISGQVETQRALQRPSPGAAAGILHHPEVGQALRAADRHIFSGKGGSYAGKITNPDAKKTYDDVMTVSGNIVKMRGCVMKVFCQSQTWTRL